jgi:hypothetical protein
MRSGASPLTGAHRLHARQAVEAVLAPAYDPKPPFVQALSCKRGRHNSLARGLFDYLVGAKQNRWGYRKAKRLGGLKV